MKKIKEGKNIVSSVPEKLNSILKTAQDKKIILNGKVTSVDDIILEFTPYIQKIARRFHHHFKEIDYEDLVMEGFYGLLVAIRKYDSDKKSKFSSYAYNWIIKFITDYIKKNFSLLRLPQRIIRLLNEYKKILTGDMPDKVVDLNKYISVKFLNLQQLSLDKCIDDEEEQPLSSIISDKSEKLSEENFEQSELEKLVRNALDNLSYEESEVIKLRFGFYKGKSYTLAAIAKKLNISVVKVTMFLEKGLKKLKKILSKYFEV